MIVLECATYRKRCGSQERVRERRAAWDRLLRELQLAAVALEEAAGPGAPDEDAWVDLARRAIWLAPALQSGRTP
jgi:hypothetical protein